MSGWYSMQRGWQDNPVFANEPYTQREAWEWLIANAAYADRTVRIGHDIVRVPRGDVPASLRYLTKAWKWKSDTRVRNFLKRIEAEGMIKIGKTDARKSLQITVCNYDAYQRSERAQNADKTQTKRKTEQGNNSLPTEGASATPSPKPASQKIDPLKVMFDSGIQIMGAAGIPEKRARPLLGKWRKALGTEGVIVALGNCQREGAVDPLTFMEGIIRHNKSKPGNRPAPQGFTRVGGQLIRDNNAKPHGGANDDRFGGNSGGGGDWPETPRDGQSTDDVSDLLPVEEEENGALSLGDDQPGGGAAALSSLRMECRV